MKLTWHGHSCFVVESGGYRIALDPYEDGKVDGLAPLRLEAEEVLCSHEHGDHNARACVTLAGGARSPFRVETIETYHDDCKGSKRGKNKIHILDDGTFCIAHLGDLGCGLEPDQVKRLSGLDALLIPVGGFFTIDAAQAKDIVSKLRPRVTIPMHYRRGAMGFGVLGTLEDYTSLCDDVVVYPGNELELTKGLAVQTAVFTL